MRRNNKLRPMSTLHERRPSLGKVATARKSGSCSRQLHNAAAAVALALHPSGKSHCLICRSRASIFLWVSACSASSIESAPQWG